MPRECRVVLERRVRCAEDMAAIEEAITKQLGGEGHRCAFLRSRAYIQLRSAALYRRQPESAHAAFYDRLSVTSVPDEEGPWVTVLWLEELEYYDDEWSASEHTPAPCQKRPRGGM